VEERRTFKIIILSILLHFLLLLLWEGGVKLNFLGEDKKPEAPTQETPIVFDLQQSNQPREVIATPDDAKVVEKQKQADYLSDKNALARNPETDPDKKIGDAFARGDFNSHDLPVPHLPLGQPQPQVQPQPEQKQKKETENKEKPETKEKDKGSGKEKPDLTPEDLLIENSGTAFYREFVLKRPNAMSPGATEQLPGITHNQQESRAEDMGGLSFNTYNWDFAPYLLMLKNQIQKNIFPPVAFSQLGLIDGETLVRFKIYPNGQMRDLVVLKYVGHESLKDTSYKAVEISAPFPQLPKDFPEPFLEITGKFMYMIHR